MSAADFLSIEKTIAASTLSYYYNKYAERYEDAYPDVLNPTALVDGISKLVCDFAGGVVPDNTILYIIEEDHPVRDPRQARYVITVTRGVGETGADAFAVRIFYSPTGEFEALSTFEDERVIWSSDNMANTRHKARTRYYLGFCYMLCMRSPGFDRDPLPEKELSVEELIAMGVQGEFPADLVGVTVPDQIERESDYGDYGEYQEEYDFDDEPDSEGDFAESESAVEAPMQDDTEIVIATPQEYEDEYDDLETDYEELFD